MALQSATSAAPLSPQVVASAFVQQYYQILHGTPEQVHKFYHDSSILGRPDSDGLMTCVTTMQAINDKIISLDFRNCFTEIETADAQLSYNNGVLIVVTGSLTGTDNVRRKFTQSFFLAPQENGGYFVLNDVFRFVTEWELGEMPPAAVNDGTSSAPMAPVVFEPEPAVLEEHRVTDPPAVAFQGDSENDDEVINPSPSEDGGSQAEDDIAVESAASVSQEDARHNFEAVAPPDQKDVPKKSYASIVKVMKRSLSPAAVHGPTSKVKQAADRTEKPLSVPVKPLPAEKPLPVPVKLVPVAETSAPSGDSNSVNNSYDAQGYSVYLRNLPLNATAEQVEEEFKKFGAIKPGGVQVRSHKVERFCFGFVEFESLKSMQAAIEASPISFGGRQVFAEEKRTTTRVINGVVTRGDIGHGGGGRFLLGRSGFRSDGFRGRGGFGNNLGYRRNDFRNRVEYSGHGRGGPAPRAVNGYQQQQVFHNGNGRFGRLNSPRPSAVSA